MRGNERRCAVIKRLSTERNKLESTNVDVEERKKEVRETRICDRWGRISLGKSERCAGQGLTGVIRRTYTYSLFWSLLGLLMLMLMLVLLLLLLMFFKCCAQVN